MDDLSHSGQECSQLFSWLWNELTTVIGTPATAAIFRRALVVTANRFPDLPPILITRKRFGYSYVIPPEVHDDTSGVWTPAFAWLANEVLTVVRDLTGEVLVRRIVQSDGLKSWKKVPDPEDLQ